MPKRVSRRVVRRLKGLYLDEILAWKRQELDLDAQKMPEADLRALAAMAPEPRDFVGTLRSNAPALVATIQRASPARGLLAHGFDAAKMARLYADAGADALAVWTDRRYFQGGVEDISAVREAVPEKPVLALDFVLSRRQVLAARAFGADAVVFFAGVLGEKNLTGMVDYAKSLGMAALVVIENEAETAGAIEASPDAIVVASRDSRTFELREERCESLSGFVSGKFFLCWETEMELRRLISAGAGGIITGERVAGAPPRAVREWFRSFVERREKDVR